MPTITKPAVVNAPAFCRSSLRAARIAAGLSRDQVAARLGRALSTVQRYEEGRAKPSADVLGALAHLYGCGVDDFYTPTPRRRPKATCTCYVPGHIGDPCPLHRVDRTT